jgi:basic membrane protein A and related proteins
MRNVVDATARLRIATRILVGTAVLALACFGALGGISSTAGAINGKGKIGSIAVILPGKTTDAGFSNLGYVTAKQAARKFGIENIKFAQSVEASEAGQVAAKFGKAHVSLVYGWGAQYMAAEKAAAARFPATVFIDTAGGEAGNGSNFATANFYGEDWSYLLGYAMGQASATHKIGFISGPCVPAIASNARAMADGARQADKQTDTTYASVESYNNPLAAKEAALAMIAAGTDIIETDLDTGNSGVFEAAEEHPGTLVTTQFSNDISQAPSVILTGTIVPEAQLLEDVISRVDAGRFDGRPIVLHLLKADEALLPIHDLPPTSTQQDTKALEVVKERIASGKIKVPRTLSCPY